MTDIIEKMAQLDVPEELVGTVNVDEILQRFRRAFSRLDDLKKIRSGHEQRNFVGRWWYNDELETAQLNAQEIQAEFSKTLGQLMIISMLQARKIESQQGLLIEQQVKITGLSTSIDRHTQSLANEHARLFAQGEELKRLVKDALDIYYAQESERKIIEIASRVEKSKDDLIAAFDERLVAVRAEAQEMEQMSEATIVRLNEQFDHRTTSLDRDMQTISDNMATQLDELQARWANSLDRIEKDQSTRLTNALKNVSVDLSAMNVNREDEQNRAQIQMGEIRADIAAMNIAHENTVRRLQQVVRRSYFAFSAIGLVAVIGFWSVHASLALTGASH